MLKQLVLFGGRVTIKPYFKIRQHHMITLSIKNEQKTIKNFLAIELIPEILQTRSGKELESIQKN